MVQMIIQRSAYLADMVHIRSLCAERKREIVEYGFTSLSHLYKELWRKLAHCG